MKIFDRLTERFRGNRFERNMKKAGFVKTPPELINRETRRRATRAAGSATRGYRLRTHMRRPLVAVRCTHFEGITQR